MSRGDVLIRPQDFPVWFQGVIERVAASESLLPSQWWREPGTSLDPEERLWLYNLIEAIVEYKTLLQPGCPSWLGIRNEARRRGPGHIDALKHKRLAELDHWFAGAPALISFTQTCEHFNLDPRTIRRVLARLRAGHGDNQWRRHF